MFQPQVFFEAGRQRSGVALMPIFDTINMILSISTRTGNTVINKGDGSSEVNYTPLKTYDFTIGIGTPLIYNYANAFTGNISVKFIQGLKDVYSIKLGHDLKPAQTEKFNISDIGAFLRQFPNLYSLMMDEYSVNANNYSNINGDLAAMPTSLERVFLRNNFVVNQNNFYLNFSSFTNLHKLKYFKGGIRLLGDLGNVPSICTYFECNYLGGNITYTAGKVWASNLETLSIPLPLNTSELDNLLIDLVNSVTSVGAGTIALGGYRSSASDAAVAYLQGLGRTVNIQRISDTVLKMPLAANLLDTSAYLNHATMVGTETHSLGGLITSTGNYAYIPNKTSLDFGTGSLVFGCKVKFNAITGTQGIMGKTIAGVVIGRYGLFLNSNNINAISQLITSSNVENTTPATPYNDGNFHSIEVICNRTTGKQMLYIDGGLINTVSFTPSNNDLAVNAHFHIGAYGNATGSAILANSEFNGIIKDVFVHKF